MALSQETERAIDLCYDAIVAPERWAKALDCLAFSLGAEACRLLPHDPVERPPTLPQSTQMRTRDE